MRFTRKWDCPLPPPHYDVYIQNWNNVQRRWVAQSAMDLFINRDKFIESLIKSLVFSGHQTYEQLVEKYHEYRRSQLFEAPFNFDDFLSFITHTEKDNLQMDSTNYIIRPDLEEALKVKAAQFLLSNNIFTDPNAVNIYSTLLWRFLTTANISQLTPAEHQLFSSILLKCSLAADGLAFIKNCIESHLGKLSEINVSQLFFSYPGGKSIFSLLIANPWYAEWLFGYKIIVTEVQEKPQIAFEPRISACPALTQALLASPITSTHLEAALHQEGSLFFWLYYFQGDQLRKSLFQAIMQFVLASPKSLYTYDALMPVLHDMQKSAHVTDVEKVLVKSFLLARIHEQISMQNDVCWLTACNLTPDVGEEHVILQYLRLNPWLLNSLMIPKNWQAFCFIVNDDRTIILQVQEQLRQLNYACFFQVSHVATRDNSDNDNDRPAKRVLLG